MEKIYETNITDLGDRYQEFLTSQGMVVLFKDNAPDELKEYCILHQKNNLSEEIETGDILRMGGKEYKITAVGDVVNGNLDKLGHITLKFDGNDTAEMKGSLHLEEEEVPSVNIGEKIVVFKE
ncbi:PTS glucitol/sorbitol transporter subunit IIA [Halanaerobacter jeridensis]|uniref:PTS system glucitol/sorbitol-specific IIA component n=1 Tax=Halanaerobacter jeridensis TaxID=706427 RepID=A0A938XWG8_9FIRM|nr:PTS glucitol/sorbitol transporter subunit IIA [Halanaerobacter jeridensis]MBM7556907.1 PTS system glucitol/sorbitol-specific IIA component [Halanaerobacter jeridensis]